MTTATIAPKLQPDKNASLAHQNICITEVNFQQKRLAGFVELHILPIKDKFDKIRLNAKQCKITKLLMRDAHSSYMCCNFSYNDPLLEIVSTEENLTSERTVSGFNAQHKNVVFTTDPDYANGEVIVQIPPELNRAITAIETLRILIEFVLEDPDGGIHFVVPDPAASLDDPAFPAQPNVTLPSVNSQSSDQNLNKSQTNNNSCQDSPKTAAKNVGQSEEEDTAQASENDQQEENATANSTVSQQNNSEADLNQNNNSTSTSSKLQYLYSHMYTYKHHNSSRLWFPCIDTYNEPCTWTMEYTVDAHMTAISCGDLVSTTLSTDKKKKTFTYDLKTPTSAPNIGLVVGHFETMVDPNIHEIVHYFLPKMRPLVQDSCMFLNECFDFYEEMLTQKYPYSSYKQIFVDEAYADYQSYATLSILNTNLLHSKHIIDQTFFTRRVLSEAVAAQYFGCFISMSSWCGAWLTRGISSYIGAQYHRKAFGNNEYRFYVQETIKKVIEYEQKHGGIILDDSSSFVRSRSNDAFHFSLQSPHTISPFYDENHKLKSFLVIRMLEDRIGRLLLLQVFNKILSLASNASQQIATANSWSNMLISTLTFEKAVFTVTGKDKEIASFLEQWIYQGGHAKFVGRFIFDRKRNVIELEIKQSDTTSLGIRPYFGPISVTVQELDGTFPQKLNIEENKTTPFTITCHSKSRRNKKKKIPLCTGEEVDMDLSMMDNSDSPVLWIRIDPDMQLLRHVVFEQPDHQWQYQLKYERDVTAQMDALKILEKYPTPATRRTLSDIIEDERCFYRVRCAATIHLRNVANQMAQATATGWQASTNMIGMYRRLFGSASCPTIVRLNNFSATDFQSYFLQKSLPIAIAGLRSAQHKVCPPDVVKFLIDLIKYNDNSKNKFSDNYYRAALIEALAETITPVVGVFGGASQTTSDQLTAETKLVAEEIARCINLEKILPCYRYTVTVACLKAIRRLQKMGHLPTNPLFFREYANYGNFVDVRYAAITELVDVVKTEQSHEDLDYLLDLVEKDNVPAVRFFVLSQLYQTPPDVPSFINNKTVFERLWELMNSRLSHDSKLRCAVVDVFYMFYGKSLRGDTSSSRHNHPNYKPKKKKKKKDKDRDKEKDKKDKERKKQKKLEKLKLLEALGQKPPQIPDQDTHTQRADSTV